MAKGKGISNAVNVGIAVQADWENREFISHISLNVRPSLNDKLDTLERHLDHLEVQVASASSKPSLFTTSIDE
ncbi:putative protein BRICK1 [Ranunculus cassubicifolius]